MKAKKNMYSRFFVGELYELGYVENNGFVNEENLGLLEMA
jgi:hypothetical protein